MNEESTQAENESGKPFTICPGCGRRVEFANGRLSNCGRYACITEFGFPKLLDQPRREVEEVEG